MCIPPIVSGSQSRQLGTCMPSNCHITDLTFSQRSVDSVDQCAIQKCQKCQINSNSDICPWLRNPWVAVANMHICRIIPALLWCISARHDLQVDFNRSHRCFFRFFTTHHLDRLLGGLPEPELFHPTSTYHGLCSAVPWFAGHWDVPSTQLLGFSWLFSVATLRCWLDFEGKVMMSDDFPIFIGWVEVRVL